MQHANTPMDTHIFSSLSLHIQHTYTNTPILILMNRYIYTCLSQKITSPMDVYIFSRACSIQTTYIHQYSYFHTNEYIYIYIYMYIYLFQKITSCATHCNALATYCHALQHATQC